MITRALGLGEYACWTEDRRVDFLVNVLAQHRRLTPPRMPTNARVAEVLDTFRMMAALHHESLGAYIITMASRPSDVLAVEHVLVGLVDLVQLVPASDQLVELEVAGAVEIEQPGHVVERVAVTEQRPP